MPDVASLLPAKGRRPAYTTKHLLKTRRQALLATDPKAASTGASLFNDWLGRGLFGHMSPVTVRVRVFVELALMDLPVHGLTQAAASSDPEAPANDRNHAEAWWSLGGYVVSPALEQRLMAKVPTASFEGVEVP